MTTYLSDNYINFIKDFRIRQRLIFLLSFHSGAKSLFYETFNSINHLDSCI